MSLFTEVGTPAEAGPGFADPLPGRCLTSVIDACGVVSRTGGGEMFFSSSDSKKEERDYCYYTIQ